MLEAFEPRSLIYIVIPWDGISFRTRLYALSGPIHELLSMSWSNDRYIVDSNLHKKIRLIYIGARVIECNYMIQVFIECLIDWNIKKINGCAGTTGNL